MSVPSVVSFFLPHPKANASYGLEQNNVEFDADNSDIYTTFTNEKIPIQRGYLVKVSDLYRKFLFFFLHEI